MFLFAGLVYVLFQVKLYEPIPFQVVPEEPPMAPSFVGRVVMPSLDDIYVLENSAGRDLSQLEKFLKSRAAGFHYAAREHYKKNTKKDPKKLFKRNIQSESVNDDVFLGIHFVLDSLGYFTPSIMFSDTEDEGLKQRVLDQITRFWKYPRGTQGKLEVWIPVRFLAKY